MVNQQRMRHHKFHYPNTGSLLLPLLTMVAVTVQHK